MIRGVLIVAAVAAHGGIATNLATAAPAPVANAVPTPTRGTVYLIKGHGELTDPDSVPVAQKAQVGQVANELRKRVLLYDRLVDLGSDVLVKDVPTDATIVMLLVPRIALQPLEWAALVRYLDRGGRMLIALDPDAGATLGPLEGKLGVKLLAGDLTDELRFLPQKQDVTDHRVVLTTHFADHPATASLFRTVNKALVLLHAGALGDTAFVGTSTPPTKTTLITSADSSFLDYNGNFVLDATCGQAEHQQTWRIGEAIEGPAVAARPRFRVLVFASAGLFADAIVSSNSAPTIAIVSGPLLDDSLRWLAGEP